MMFKLLAAVVVIAIIAAIVRKRTRRKELLGMFWEYNQNQDRQVVVRWVQAKDSVQRLAAVLEYLMDIEQEITAAEILEDLDLDYLHHRHVLIFATQAFMAAKNPKALDLADLLRNRYPKDDSILDIYIQVQLAFNKFKTAKDALVPRLQRKYKGTIFTRHYAQILAHEGDLERAIEIMEKVVKRDFVLSQNTFAVPQKHLIRRQFEQSRAILDSLRKKLEEAAPPDRPPS